MGLAVLVGWGIGYWLDSRYGTTPWLMLLFLCLGVAAGFKGVLRAAKLAKQAARIEEPAQVQELSR